ncbi:hypothetical protein SEUCBS139899_000734 [Sporothrix eucalyptigena]|uniref:DUF7907 domain-containing protein n=1 Tax=Sporothrix eucalyptigena TaxID=1812306 RepID=A0ABP0AUW6_9PEZI
MPRGTLFVTVMIASASALLWTLLGCPTLPNPFKNYITVVSDNNNPFVLKTQVKNGGDSKYNGLYVYAYHTGAGLNDAMLRPETDRAVSGTAFTGGADSDSSLGAQYFAVLYQLGGLPYELMPVTGWTPYPDLQPVRINVNGSPPDVNNAFYFKNNRLQWTSSANISPPGGFGGWLACDSSHSAIGAPSTKGIQLFYRTDFGTAPEGCADVDLLAIY